MATCHLGNKGCCPPSPLTPAAWTAFCTHTGPVLLTLVPHQPFLVLNFLAHLLDGSSTVPRMDASISGCRRAAQPSDSLRDVQSPCLWRGQPLAHLAIFLLGRSPFFTCILTGLRDAAKPVGTPEPVRTGYGNPAPPGRVPICRKRGGKRPADLHHGMWLDKVCPRSVSV